MIRASYVDAIPEPWSRESPWTQYTLQDLAVNGKSRFYKPDIWHNVNLGVGKDFVSAAMCLLVRDLEGPNINEKFDILSKKYLQWCRVFHKTKYVTKLDKKWWGGQACGTNRMVLGTRLPSRLHFWNFCCTTVRKTKKFSLVRMINGFSILCMRWGLWIVLFLVYIMRICG